MATGKYANKTDSQLKELAASLQSAADYCVQQQGTFWGQGFTEGADMFAKNGEDLAAQAQSVNDELQKRREANMSDAEKKALKEQGEDVSVLPPNLAPADQPTPATQPVELSTEAQKNQTQQHSGGSSSSSSSSTAAKNSSSDK